MKNGNVEEYENGSWVYGIAHRDDKLESGGLHRTGMTEREAQQWIEEWRNDGGSVSAFRVVRQRVCPWVEMPDSKEKETNS